MPRIKWFATRFPNRRYRKPVVEVTIRFSNNDRRCFPQKSTQVTELLIDGGILSPEEEFPFEDLPEERMSWYGSLLGQMALLFQRKTGHRVDYHSAQSFPETQHCLALVEHEHWDVGMTAVKLAGEIMQGKRKFLREPFRIFSDLAHSRLLPRDTEAIIEAAKRRDIPSIKLERLPYHREKFDHVTGGKCIRKNGLLMLGHGVHQRVLDGTFCIDRSAAFRDLLEDRGQCAALLEKLGIPAGAADDNHLENRHRFQLLVVNGKITAATVQTGESVPAVEAIHPSWADLALALNREIGLAPLSLAVEATGLGKPPSESGGRILDFRLAPELDQVLQSDSALQSTAEEIVEWLYPEPVSARMPTIAITGTNGKTTTSRMISHVMAGAGRKPGLVCSDGVYLDGNQVVDEDKCTDTGHLMVLTSKEVDVAVLESHHSGIFRRGFAFDRCDIAVCLNVTADHLGKAGIDSLEQMAEVKRALPENARKAAVLNADDAFCLAMLDGVSAEKSCLVSMQLSPDEMVEKAGRRIDVFCVLETLQEAETIVIHERGQSIPVIATAGIPATFGGAARFNVSNAMHATAAAWLAEVDPATIADSLACFGMNYEDTPGRQNVYDGHPFQVIMDYAHNKDSFTKLGDFIDRLKVPGRKVLMFQARSDLGEASIVDLAAAAAGHFDHFVCRPHPVYRQMENSQVLGLMRQGLTGSGVEDRCITEVIDPDEAVETTLQMGRRGDLLVLAPGRKQREATWDRILSFNPRTAPE